MNKPLAYLKDTIVENNTIPVHFFEEFDVKRGLRNKDGSGVLAGLSQISSVVGTSKNNGVMTPVEGILNYRDTAVLDLVAQFKKNQTTCSFEVTAFLLLVGHMPNDEELQDFRRFMIANRDIPPQILDHIIKPIPSKNIMNKMMTSISALYAFDEHPDTLDPYENFCKSAKLIAKLPMVIAYSYLSAFKKDPKYVKPLPEHTHAESFLYMLREGGAYTAQESQILDLCLMLHAEHGGGNNSTFTTYVVTSSGTDIYSALSAAVASLKGPLHGAANKKVEEMITNIKKHVPNWTDKEALKKYLTKILKKEANDHSGKLYGLGHAVYTKSDPRGVALKSEAASLAKTKDREEDFQLLLDIEEFGPDLFNEVKGSNKVISPNVDFFSGFVYDCLNIPASVFTPLFAMARSVGWSAHRIEEILSGKRIIRPGYKYVG